MKKKNKSIIGLCLVLLLVVCYLNWKFEVIAVHPFAGSDDYDIRVMTWNIHASKDIPLSKQRAIARLIKEHNVDFLLLNEFNKDQCELLYQELASVYRYSEEQYANKECGDIFFSKIALNKSGHIEIPVLGKSVPSISATIQVAGREVFVTGVHLEPNSGDGSAIITGIDSLLKIKKFFGRYRDRQKERKYSMMWVKGWIQARHMPTIVMGDMNDFSCSQPMDSLKIVGMKDAWWEGGFGYGCTFHTGWMCLRIDHILYSNELKLQSIKVIDTNLSDHNPVVAGFCVNN